MKVRFTQRALRHLDTIFNWIAQESPHGAERQIARVRHSIELLERFPVMGHQGKSPKTLELVVPRTSYIVVYRLTDDEVQILSIFDGRRRKAPR